VRCGALREGFVGGVVAQLQLQLRSEAVSVSVRTNVSPCLLSLSARLCSLRVFFFVLFCFVLFCFAWTLCNLQMYDAGGYPVEAAVPDIGYSALAALPTLPSNLDCSTTHARSLMDLARSRLEIAVMRQS
jgi:hypothetical protein